MQKRRCRACRGMFVPKAQAQGNAFVRTSRANESDDGAGRRRSGGATPTIGITSAARSVHGPSTTPDTGRNIAGSARSTP